MTRYARGQALFWRLRKLAARNQAGQDFGKARVGPNGIEPRINSDPDHIY